MDDKSGEVITLVDEDGQEIEFYMLDFFHLEGMDYVVLQPVGKGDEEENQGDEGELSAEEGEEEAIILRVTDDEEGQSCLYLIEDEEEWQKVSQVAYERLQSEE